MNAVAVWPILAVLVSALAASVIVAMLVMVWRMRGRQARHPAAGSPDTAQTAAGVGVEDRRVADRLHVVAARLAQVRQRLADAASARQSLATLGSTTSTDMDVDHALAQARAALDDQADALKQLALWYNLRSAGPWPTEAQCLQIATTPLADLSWRLRHHLAEAETRLSAVRQLHHLVVATAPAGTLHHRIRLRLCSNLENWEAQELARCEAWRGLAGDPDTRDTCDLADFAARPPAPVDNAVLTTLVSDIAALDDLTAHPWMRGAAQTSDAVGAWQASLLATRDELHSRAEAFLEMDDLLGDTLAEPDDASAGADVEHVDARRDVETAPIETASPVATVTVAATRGSLLLVLLVAVGVSGAACGTDGGGTTPRDASVEVDDPAPDTTQDDAPPIDDTDVDAADGSDQGDALAWYVQTVCTAQAAYECAAWRTCGCPAEAVSPDGCEAGVVARCSARAAEALAGRTPPVRVDRAAATACADGLAALPIDCGEPPQRFLVPDCAAALVVARDVGERCVLQDAPCGDGTARCRDGRCTEMPAHGASCLVGTTPDAGCSIYDVCVAGRCAPPPQNGQRCDRPDHCPAAHRCVDTRCAPVAVQDDACDDERPCAPGASCLDGRCVAGDPSTCTAPGPSQACGNESLCGAPVDLRCTARGEEGTACVSNDACLPGLVCDGGRCGTGPQVDAPCLDGITCGVGFACDFAGERCLPVPQQGELCAPGPQGPHVCADGLGCVAGRCAPMPLAGESCTTDGRCSEGLGCHYADTGSQCAPPNPVGGPCQNDSMCGRDAFCDFSRAVCAAQYDAGEACVLGNECGPAGACLPELDGGFRCGTLPGVEEPCFLACQPDAWCEPRRGAFSCYPARCQRAP